MRRTRSFCLHLPLCLQICFLAFLSIGVSGSPSRANAVEPVSFSWQANPPEDYVLGYKLYYGSESRFDSSGRPKTDFSYDYYIDFSDFERCIPGTGDTVCETLSTSEVECEDLSGYFPSCTLHNLRGKLYFSLTAYNAYAESDYTLELRIASKSDFPLLQFIHIILLQKRNNT